MSCAIAQSLSAAATSPAAPSRYVCRRERLGVFKVYAGKNTPPPNFIEIGSASSQGWPEIRIVRTGGDGSSTTKGVRGNSSAKRSKESKKKVEDHSECHEDVPAGQQQVVVDATKRGRAGKTVTVIKGLQLTEESLQSLCKTLKTKIGAGGAVKGSAVEIQGITPPRWSKISSQWVSRPRNRGDNALGKILMCWNRNPCSSMVSELDMSMREAKLLVLKLLGSVNTHVAPGSLGSKE